MDLGLAGRAYLVTGGSRGLGLATAAALVADGARVVVSGRDREAVDEAARSLGGPEVAVGVAADNADPRTPERLVAAAQTTFGRLDGALVSVGGPPTGSVLDVPDDTWRTSFEAVFLGAVRLLREVLPRLGADGAVGLVLSTSVKSPLPALALSNGLRPGLGMLVKDVADEVGPRGVRVFGLMPAGVETDRLAGLDAGDPDPEAARARRSAGVPLRRLARPAEFGRVAAFLLSPAASYVTGTVVAVDGGALRSL